MSDANGGGSLTALPIIETQVRNESHTVKNLFFIYRMSLLSHPSGRRRVRLHPDQRDLHHGRPDLLGDGALLQGHPPRHQRRPLRLQGRLRRAAEGHEAGMNWRLIPLYLQLDLTRKLISSVVYTSGDMKYLKTLTICQEMAISHGSAAIS